MNVGDEQTNRTHSHIQIFEYSMLVISAHQLVHIIVLVGYEARQPFVDAIALLA